MHVPNSHHCYYVSLIVLLFAHEIRRYTPCQTYLCHECASVGRFRHSEKTYSSQALGNNVTLHTTTTSTCDNAYCAECKVDAIMYETDRKQREQAVRRAVHCVQFVWGLVSLGVAAAVVIYFHPWSLM